MAISRLLKASLVRESGIYSLSNAVGAGIAFVLTLMLTHHLTPADMGLVSMFQVLLGVAGPFVGLSIHGAIGRQTIDQEDMDFPTYVGSCMVVLAASSLAAALLVWAAGPWIAAATSFPQAWLVLVVPLAAGQFVALSLLSIWQMHARAGFYGAFQVFQAVFGLALTVWLVVSLGWDWEGRVTAQAVTISLFGILALTFMRSGGWLQLRWQPEYVRHALAFSVPLIPHALGMWVMFSIDRVFITRYAGMSDTGVYSIAFQFGMLLNLVHTSFNQAWIPWLFRRLKLDSPADDVQIVRISYGYFATMVAIAVAVAVLTPWLLHVFVDVRYHGAVPYVQWLALAITLNGMAKMMVAYLFYANRTGRLATLTFAVSVFHGGACWLLVHLNGALGAAQALTLSFLVNFVACSALAHGVRPMPWLKALIPSRR